MKSYPPKLVGETRSATMDFTAQLASIGIGVTLVSCTVVATLYQGTDSNPAGILLGSVLLDGQVAGQWITAGVAGVIYIITWTATGSDGSIIIRQRLLPVFASWP